MRVDATGEIGRVPVDRHWVRGRAEKASIQIGQEVGECPTHHGHHPVHEAPVSGEHVVVAERDDPGRRVLRQPQSAVPGGRLGGRRKSGCVAHRHGVPRALNGDLRGRRELAVGELQAAEGPQGALEDVRGGLERVVADQVLHPQVARPDQAIPLGPVGHDRSAEPESGRRSLTEFMAKV